MWEKVTKQKTDHGKNICCSPNRHDVNLFCDDLISLLDVFHPTLFKVHLPVLKELGVAFNEVQGEASVPPRKMIAAHTVAQTNLNQQRLTAHPHFCPG